jgi:hypothetical protein
MSLVPAYVYHENKIDGVLVHTEEEYARHLKAGFVDSPAKLKSYQDAQKDPLIITTQGFIASDEPQIELPTSEKKIPK